MLNTTFVKDMPPRGHIAFLSQSGALCGGIIDWTRVRPVKVKPGIRRCAVMRHPPMLRSSCASASVVTLAAARGEPLEEPGGLERRVQRLQEQLVSYTTPAAS